MFRDNLTLFSGTTVTELNKLSKDYFNTIERAQYLIKILEMKEVIKNIKMIAVYAGWGAGKTTYIKYVKDKVSKDNRASVFFEAWKLEFGHSLHLSLLECIFKELRKDKNGERFNEVLKLSMSCLELARNIVLSTSVELPILKIDLGKAGKDTISEYKALNDSKSAYSNLEKFKEEYEKLISKCLNDEEELLVFVDDLDRCEPENVVFLLSVIKHFFTYDHRVKFICAIDKEAVTKALKVKYRDTVKSTEYLEKIFDFTLTLRTSNDFSELIRYYCQDESDTDDFIEFLTSIHLTNPRHLIKVLNRAYILTRILLASENKSRVFEEGESKKKLSECGYKECRLFYDFLIYFIMFKEFRPEEFETMSDIFMKQQTLIQSCKEYRKDPTSAIDSFQQITINFKDGKSINSKHLYDKAGDSYIPSIQFKRLYTMLYSEKASIKNEQDFAYNLDEMRNSIRFLSGIEGNYAYNFLNYLFYNPKSILSIKNIQADIHLELTPKIETDIQFDIYELYNFILNN